jgi:hypothetical protein
MTRPEREHNPLRYRRVWWTRPDFLIFSICYLAIGAYGVRLISELGFGTIASLLGIFWIIMFAVLVVLYRRIFDEPNVYVKQSVVDKTVQGIRAHRKKVRREFIGRELAQLANGEKCNVLDIWKIDPVLSARHAFFAATRVSKIDPSVRELHIRIQVKQVDPKFVPVAVSSKQLLYDTVDYMKTLAEDGYLSMLKGYFDRIIVVIDRLDSDDRGAEIAVPVLSLELEAQALTKIEQTQSFDIVQLRRLADFRYDDWKPIQALRDIDLPKARGAK